MDSYYPMKHSDKDFIYCFNLVVGLWIVGGLVFMSKTQLVGKFRHHKVSKMATVISNDSLWDPKSSNNMIKYEKGFSFPSIFESRHRLGPFREIIHGYDNVSLPLGRVRVTCHEIDTPFSEISDGNYRV
jgi:hypothetical protein